MAEADDLFKSLLAIIQYGLRTLHKWLKQMISSSHSWLLFYMVKYLHEKQITILIISSYVSASLYV